MIAVLADIKITAGIQHQPVRADLVRQLFGVFMI